MACDLSCARPPSSRDLCVKGFITRCTIGRVETLGSGFSGRPFGHWKCSLEVRNEVPAPCILLSLCSPEVSSHRVSVSLVPCYMMCCSFSAGPKGLLSRDWRSPNLEPQCFHCKWISSDSCFSNRKKIDAFPVCHPFSPHNL